MRSPRGVSPTWGGGCLTWVGDAYRVTEVRYLRLCMFSKHPILALELAPRSAKVTPTDVECHLDLVSRSLHQVQHLPATVQGKIGPREALGGRAGDVNGVLRACGVWSLQVYRGRRNGQRACGCRQVIQKQSTERGPRK